MQDPREVTSIKIYGTTWEDNNSHCINSYIEIPSHGLADKNNYGPITYLPRSKQQHLSASNSPARLVFSAQLLQ